MNLSRRERRMFAKKLGLTGKSETYDQMAQRYNRSIAAGRYLHTHHIQDMKNLEISEESSDDENHQEGDINPFGFLGKK